MKQQSAGVIYTFFELDLKMSYRTQRNPLRQAPIFCPFCNEIAFPSRQPVDMR